MRRRWARVALDLGVLLGSLGLGWIGPFELAWIVLVEAIVLYLGIAVLMMRTTRIMRADHPWLAQFALAPYAAPPNAVRLAQGRRRWHYGDRAARRTGLQATLATISCLLGPMALVVFFEAARATMTPGRLLIATVVAVRLAQQPLAVLRDHRDGLTRDDYVTIGAAGTRLIWHAAGYWLGLMLAVGAAAGHEDAAVFALLVAAFIAIYGHRDVTYRPAHDLVDRQRPPVRIDPVTGQPDPSRPAGAPTPP